MAKKNIIIILIIAVVLALFLAFGILFVLGLGYLAETSVNYVNEENAIEVENTEIIEKEKYVDNYVWDYRDVKTFNNTYYVDRGYEESPLVQNYVVLRIETNKGDLKEGNYKFETFANGSSFLIYIVDEPIADLNTYESSDYKSVYYQIPTNAYLKKGQYVYIVQGFNGKGAISITLDT